MNIEKVKQIFDLNADKNYIIQKNQLPIIFQQLNSQLPKELDKILDLIDPQQSQPINFVKFKRLYYISINDQDPLSILFHAADKDYDGSLQPQELADFLVFLGYKGSKDDFLKFAKTFASDGEIEKQSFKNAMEWLVE